MEFWSQVKDFLSYSLFEISLSELFIALLIFFSIYLLRQIFFRIGINFFRKLTSRTKTTIDDQIIDVIEPPARFFLVVVGLWASFTYLNSVSQLEEPIKLVTHIIRSLFAFSFFWAAYRANNMLEEILKKVVTRTRSDIDDQIVSFVIKFLRVAVVMLGVMVVVREWGYDIAGLIAGLGLGGLAVALAAKDTVANIFGSITILLDRPFSVGDWIETPSVEGTVEDIHLRSTRIRTFANALVSVPNSILANNPITNWTLMKKRRIKYKLGVTYNTTHEQMEKCVKDLKSMLGNHPDIHPDTIFVYFNDFGDNALEIFLYFFTNTTNWQEYLSVRQDVNLKIMKIIEQNGMSVAFPSRSIYMETHNVEFLESSSDEMAKQNHSKK